MGKKIYFLMKGITYPIKAIHYVFVLIDNKFKLTEVVKVSGSIKRLVIKN
jgi:hypothetical protein